MSETDTLTGRHLTGGDRTAGDPTVPPDPVAVLDHKAGRLAANGLAAGAYDAMGQSGTVPASKNFGATRVGTLAIRRVPRPVCHQNIPADLLPADLRP